MEKTEVVLPSKETIMTVLSWLHSEKEEPYINCARSLTAVYGSKLGMEGGMQFIAEMAKKTMSPEAAERAAVIEQIQKYMLEDGLPEHIVMMETSKASLILGHFYMQFGTTPQIVRQESQYTIDVGLPGIFFLNPEA